MRVVVEVGTRTTTVFSAEGVLRHEVAEDVADGEAITPKAADNILRLLGYYVIGDYAEDGTHLDLTDWTRPRTAPIEQLS